MVEKMAKKLWNLQKGITEISVMPMLVKRITIIPTRW
jgi:hypothetical protein